jgi:hypothetical protein
MRGQRRETGMKRIPTAILALAIALVVELVLLFLGGFRLGWGPTGPDSAVLFLSHFVPMLLVALLSEFLATFAMDESWMPVRSFEVLIAIVNVALNWAILAILIRWRRKRRAAREAGTE